jgi:hypothetical protein
MGLDLTYNYLPKQKGQSLRIDALFLAKVYATRTSHKRATLIHIRTFNIKQITHYLYVNGVKIKVLKLDEFKNLIFLKKTHSSHKKTLQILSSLTLKINLINGYEFRTKYLIYEDVLNVLAFIRRLNTEYSLETLYDNFGKHYEEFLNEQSKVADFYYELISDDTKNGYPLFLDYETTNKM